MEVKSRRKEKMPKRQSQKYRKEKQRSVADIFTKVTKKEQEKSNSKVKNQNKYEQNSGVSEMEELNGSDNSLQEGTCNVSSPSEVLSKIDESLNGDGSLFSNEDGDSISG